MSNPLERPAQDGPASHEVPKSRTVELAQREGYGLAPDVVGRIGLLDARSTFAASARRVAGGVRRVASRLRGAGSRNEFLLDDSALFVAALLHDIGKSGPATATRTQQESFLAAFAMENARPGESLFDTVKNAHPNDGEGIIGSLRGLGFTDVTTMREFWDTHSEHGYHILWSYSGDVTDKMRNVAMAHHINARWNSPPEWYGKLGFSESIPPDVFLLMIVDKYEAARWRGKKDHADAMNVVRSAICRDGFPPENAKEVFEAVFLAVDLAGREDPHFLDEP